MACAAHGPASGTARLLRPVRTLSPSHATPLLLAGLNKYSSRITQPKYQGASQAMLYATGLKEEDMSKPQVNEGRHPAPAVASAYATTAFSAIV